MADVNVKTIQTRIALKYDSYANWTNEEVADQGANLVLLRGELGICEVKATNPQTKDAGIIPTVLFKVGDGETPFKDLPWASAKAADVYAWAKAEDVVVEGKSIKFVGVKDAEGNDKKITFNFATPEEVAAAVKVVADDLSDLDARVVALEGKFTGDNDVQGQLNALDGRLDVIEGTDGAIATGDAATLEAAKSDAATKASTAESNAKAYAKEYADGIATEQAKTDAAQDAALAAYKSEVTTALAGKQDVIPANTYDAHGAAAQALTDAKAYTDEREAAIETAYKAYADQAEVDAKAYTDVEVGKLNAKDAELNTAIGNNATAIADEKAAREGADNAINAKFGDGIDADNTVVDAIATAKQAAIDSAAATAQSKVDALANGQVKTNKEAIATNAGEIARVEGLVTAEAKAREDADKAIDERLVEVETFFKTAEGETINQALDTLVEIQKYITDDGTAAGEMVDAIEANAKDIDALEGRMDTAESDIDKLEAKDAELANADKALGERIDALVGDNGTIATGDATTLASAKSYADGKASAAETAAKSYADGVAATAKSEAVEAANGYTDGQISSLKSTLDAADEALEGNVKTLQDIVDGYETKGSIKAAVEAAAELAQDGVDAAGVAQAAADKAQGEIDALELVVNNETTGLVATKKIADDAAADLAALTGDNGRVKAAENAINALELIVNDASKGNAQLRTDVNALQELTGENGAIRSEIADAKKAGTDAAAAVTALTNGQVATNKTDIGTLNGKVAAIEADYLKAADAYIFNCGSATTVTHKA